ncbi:hypothetical protein [Dictyobacter alpinus]|uniref:hypothetical protein n=1 Tax=Dictyobacter alpinus TaxID=2014873 RepID=UPI0013866476|nr:hypothetical protein [Dictyobacter alpinus]
MPLLYSDLEKVTMALRNHPNHKDGDDENFGRGTSWLLMRVCPVNVIGLGS